eukprot:jgi/Mesen1/6779/ME000348S06053
MGKLERLLLDKNRKMEHELTQVKVQLSEKEKEAVAARERIQQLEIREEEQGALISRLEEDIMQGYGSSDRRASKASNGAGTSGSGHNGGGGVGGGAGAGGWDVQESDITDLLYQANERAPGGEEEENSMLAVVCGQRDRFRQKMAQLEEELGQSKDRCQKLKADLERTKGDNVKLYEKIRYVQGFNSDRLHGHGHGQAGTVKKQREDIETGGSTSEVEMRYKKMYEDNINPFAAFSNKEKEQRYKDLGLRDRITLTSGRFLLGNRYARAFVFFYSIALHLLVFVSMYALSMNSHYGAKSDVLCSKQGALTAGLQVLAQKTNSTSFSNSSLHL